MKKLIFIGSTLFFLPTLALAQFSNVQNYLERFLNIINNTLLPIVIALALLYFFWGLAQFILSAGDEEARKEARQRMLWGIIAFFVMVSVWGLVNFLDRAFELNNATPNLPRVPR